MDSLHTHFRVDNLTGLDKHGQSCNGRSVMMEHFALPGKFPLPQIRGLRLRKVWELALGQRINKKLGRDSTQVSCLQSPCSYMTQQSPFWVFIQKE